MNYLELLVTILISIFFLINSIKISDFFNLYDYPNEQRKIHINKISNIGGLGVFLIILNNFFFSFFTSLNEFKFNELIFLIDYPFFISSFCFLILGFIDDRRNLKPLYKLISLCLFVCFIIFLNEKIIIKNLNFKSFENVISLGQFSILFTIFCFFAFSQALNMFDGVNGNATIYSIFALIFLFIKSNNFIFIFLIIYLILFLIFNLKNKIFLGNSGSLLLSFIIGYFCISLHNDNKIFADEIYLLMLIPGLDMARLFFQRFLNKKSPFEADKNHLHHIMLSKIGIQKYLFFLSTILFVTLYFLSIGLVIWGILLTKLFYFFAISFKGKN